MDLVQYKPQILCPIELKDYINLKLNKTRTIYHLFCPFKSQPKKGVHIIVPSTKFRRPKGHHQVRPCPCTTTLIDIHRLGFVAIFTS